MQFRGSRRIAILAMPALVVALGGCDDETGVPQPVPIPGPNPDYVRTTGALRGADREVHVVGLPSAVSGVGEVIIKNGRSGLEQTAKSDEAGSFAAFIEARGGDELTLGFVGSDDEATIEVGELNISLISPMPEPIPGVDPMTVTSDAKAVIVRGRAAGLASVIAVNLATGHSATAEVESDTTFEIRIAGTSGDDLRVYGDADPLSDPWELTIP